MMQSFALMALITVLWALVGLQPVLRRERASDRGFEHAFLRGVGAYTTYGTKRVRKAPFRRISSVPRRPGDQRPA